MGHTIISVYGNNWEGMVGLGNLKRVPEELQRVARLGSPTGGGYRNPKSYALAYDFTVNAQYPIFWLQLASVMDRSHSGNQNTHFKYSIKNAIGTPLTQPCYGFRMYSNRIEDVALGAPNISFIPNIPGSIFPAISSVAYQTWRSITIDMTAYIGQTLTLELEHYDCYTGAHGSYTYLSAAMRSPYDTFYFCRGANTTTIKPYQPNFHSYLWNTAATTDSLVISNPTDGAIYNCKVGSYNGCDVTFTYILKEVKANADFNFVGGGTCNQIQYHDQSKTNVGKIVNWYWNFGDPTSGLANTDTVQNPLHKYSSPGDYTVSLTVTDTFGCTNTIVKTVSVSPESIIAQIKLPNPSCVNAPLAFEDVTSTSTSRIWYVEGKKIDDTSKIMYHSFQHPGTFHVMLIALGSNGCPDTTTQLFEVFSLPKSAIQVIPYTLAAPVTMPEFQFKGLEENATNYVWNFGYGSTTTTGQYTKVTYPPELAEYKVLLKTFNQYGCHDSSSVIVNIMPPDFWIPNAFSPNGDGVNDVFKVMNITNHQLKEFSIFNRDGQRVFYGQHLNSGWDGTLNGKPCDLGTYYYLLRYSMPNSDQEYVMKGDVTLIR